jgi:hypothetical protein
MLIEKIKERSTIRKFGSREAHAARGLGPVERDPLKIDIIFDENLRVTFN